ncbi:hypothetical protein PLICRDRAFT_160956 [Plicaturopsis crispa FD-325 SS-3]|nr:hypothetical protein PLICRDRAFT_160956 [Plicaturopsis crispa FD-325 SS-3]
MSVGLLRTLYRRLSSTTRNMSDTGAWRRVPAHGSTPPFSVFTKPIVTSQQDDREYRLIRLENGLEAMLIHDAKADKAAASLDVAVGHLSDPDDMPGLAHFCEHLLFMGTEQYPKENEYSEYLSKNNGSSNAYTATSNTNYYFSVATPALSGALDRFAGFFHSPLFAPSCTTRELNAVDSEHKKNHQADMWRIFQLNKELSKDGHVWKKFGSGNKESLSRAGKELKAKGKLNGAPTPSASSSLAPSPIPSRISSPAPSIASANSEVEADGGAVGRETRRRLVEWWSKEYCASRMRLCVIGKESLDVLADTVSTLFSPIKNRGQEALPMITDHPFGPNETRRLVSVQTIMSFHAVEISFPLAYQPPYYRTKPGSFVGHFLGHEGPGSLHSYLKGKGWLTGLSAGPQSLGRGFSMFKITISLTNEGFQNYRAVLLAVFNCISLLRSSAFPAWYQKEISTIYSTRFRFAEKTRPDDYAVWVAEHLTWPVPKELVISAPQLVWEWDEAGEAEREVRKVLDGLTIDKGRAVLMAKGEEHAKIGGKNKTWRQEPVYGTEYAVEHFDEEFIAKAQGPNTIPELHLPGPNEFIPTNLDVDKREVAEPLKRPHLIRETPLMSVWHKKDDQFWVPKAHVVLDIRSPLANASPKASVLTRLFADLVNDALAEFSYDADLAGLRYSFANHTLGVWVSLSGYNDKMGVLARHVLEKVKHIVADPVRLEVMKEQIKRDWENFFMGQSYRISDYYGRALLTEKQWTLAEKLPLVPLVTAAEVQEHARQLLSAVNIRMLVGGNMYKDEALSIADMAAEILGSSPLPASEIQDRALILPQSSNFIWTTPVPNTNEPNSALTYYLHFGQLADARLRVTSALLSQILTEPAFNVLRTQEQLGYIVSCSQWHLAGAGDAGLRIVVQSERAPAFLESRVDAFLHGMRGVIEEMGEEEFKEQKGGLERKWREGLKNLGEETNRFWAQIDSGALDFYRRERDADMLQQEITKDDVLALFLSHIHPASPTRSKLAIHAPSQKPRPKKVSAAAAAAFEVLVRDAGITFAEGEWREELGGADGCVPAEFVKYWVGVIGEGGDAKTLLAAVPGLMAQYPAEGDAEPGVREGATYIEDVQAFKSGLRASEEVKPVVEWGDLPVSKF